MAKVHVNWDPERRKVLGYRVRTQGPTDAEGHITDIASPLFATEAEAVEMLEAEWARGECASLLVVEINPYGKRVETVLPKAFASGLW